MNKNSIVKDLEKKIKETSKDNEKSNSTIANLKDLEEIKKLKEENKIKDSIETLEKKLKLSEKGNKMKQN